MSESVSVSSAVPNMAAASPGVSSPIGAVGRAVSVIPSQLNIEARPRLKEILVEATDALSKIDARRLESLVEHCRTLFTDGGVVAATGQPVSAEEALEAQQSLAIFGRLMEQTGEHLSVYKRVREIAWRRSGGGYSEREVASGVASRVWYGPRVERASGLEGQDGND